MFGGRSLSLGKDRDDAGLRGFYRITVSLRRVSSSVANASTKCKKCRNRAATLSQLVDIRQIILWRGHIFVLIENV